MNIALWVLQSLLAFAFCAAGAMKLAKSRAALLTDKRMAWANDFETSHIKLIGLAEVLGGIGLVLPLALHVLPLLTPVAAAGLALLMAGAVATHVRRKESPVVPALLGVLSAVVAVGRFALL
jgi:uncharacterized membrane protein YphA (DoxX/SURF4 family)